MSDITSSSSDDHKTERSSIHRHRLLSDVSSAMILKSSCIFASTMVAGMQIALAGDTLVQMAFLFDTGMATISTTFIATAVGFTVGSLCSGVVYDRWNHELSFVAAHVTNGLVTMAAPYTSVNNGGGLPAYIFIMFVQGFTTGFFSAGGQAYLMNLWCHHRLCNSILHAQNALWSLGAATGPMIIEIFLVQPPEIHDPTSTSTPLPQTTDQNERFMGNQTESLPANSSLVSFDDVFLVSYSFVALGATLFIPSLLFAMAHLHDNLTVRHGRVCACRTGSSTELDGDSESSVLLNNEQGQQEVTKTGEGLSESQPQPGNISMRSRIVELIFMASIVLFFFIFQFIEVMPILLLPAFAIKYLKFSAHVASNLLTVFSGVQIIVKVLAVPLSAIFQSVTLVFVNLSLAVFSNGLLLAFVDTWPDVIWPATVITGLAVSTTFPASLMWITETYPLTGRLSSLIFCGYSMSSAFGPAFIGWLFETVSPMSFVYMELASSVGHLILFSCMLTAVKQLRIENQ